jgi:hypothetical protein
MSAELEMKFLKRAKQFAWAAVRFGFRDGPVEWEIPLGKLRAGSLFA